MTRQEFLVNELQNFLAFECLCEVVEQDLAARHYTPNEYSLVPDAETIWAGEDRTFDFYTGLVHGTIDPHTVIFGNVDIHGPLRRVYLTLAPEEHLGGLEAYLQSLHTWPALAPVLEAQMSHLLAGQSWIEVGEVEVALETIADTARAARFTNPFTGEIIEVPRVDLERWLEVRRFIDQLDVPLVYDDYELSSDDRRRLIALLTWTLHV